VLGTKRIWDTLAIIDGGMPVRKVLDRTDGSIARLVGCGITGIRFREQTIGFAHQHMISMSD